VVPKLPYTSSIKDMPFMFFEMRRTAGLLCDGKTQVEIVELSMTHNIYQLGKEKRRRDVPLRMINRLSTIDVPLVTIVANGRDEDAKLVAFFALMKADRLLSEYMCEVYADKYHSGQNEITDQDFLIFIERKVQNSDVIATWTVNNLIRVRNTYKNILCDAGLAKRVGSALLIQKPISNPHIRELIKGEDVAYAKAMLLEG
jgi:hypothetical protein